MHAHHLHIHTELKYGETFKSYVISKKNFFIQKRLFDILFSSLVIVFILSWLVPLLSIFILLESKGPVFFIQKRIGMGGKIFLCLKFRTMVVNKFANSKQAAENDVRITRIGNFLRKSNLDEFPQFLNVFIGQMSIVGPRPHMLTDCNNFSKVIKAYKFRNMVKPGITGLAQVKGYRGVTKDFTSIFGRYQYDAFYIRNACFGLDFRIINKTILQTFQFFVKITGKNKNVRHLESSIQKITFLKRA